MLRGCLHNFWRSSREVDASKVSSIVASIGLVEGLHNVDFRLHCHNIKYNFRKKQQQQEQQQEQQQRRQKYILRDKCRFSSILLIWLNKPSRYEILQNICLDGNTQSTGKPTREQASNAYSLAIVARVCCSERLKWKKCQEFRQSLRNAHGRDIFQMLKYGGTAAIRDELLKRTDEINVEHYNVQVVANGIGKCGCNLRRINKLFVTVSGAEQN
uniref:Uncharacterized protein n=1 Tax=Glossina pallidipes TaxID=7398 RepID=A0A1B0A2V3_GLOPL